MAQKTETLVTLIDDIDGTKADRTIEFTFDGTAYAIELSKKNATAFEKALKPYIDAARKTRNTGRTRGRAGGGQRRSRGDLGAIREWAKANGYEVSARGRISQAIQDAYNAAK